MAEPRPAKSEQEKKIVFRIGRKSDPVWTAAAAALAAYGVYTDCLRGAADNGWQADQVQQLLADCAAKAIAGVRAWGPGLIYRHLQLAPAGAPIRSNPCEAYTRAKRDQELELARQCGEAAADAADEMRRAIEEHDAALEAAYGPMLDGLPPEDLDALVHDVAGDFGRRLSIRNGIGLHLRLTLLAELKRRAAELEAGHE